MTTTTDTHAAADLDVPDEASAVNTGRRRTITTALLVVLGLMIGGIAGYGLTRLGVPGEDSPEAGFARDMSTHHGQAVSMGSILYRTTEDDSLASISFDIIATQQGQIGVMQTWLEDWNLGPNSSEAPMAWMGHTPGHHEATNEYGMPGMATKADIARLRELRGRDQNVLFCQLMIRHHQGGVTMADGVLARSDNRDVRHLAESIKTSQNSEINALNQSLTRLGAPAVR